MIEIYINKDVGSYQAKFIGPFTLRQTICLAVASPFCWMIYKYLSPALSPDIAGFFVVIPAGIAWVFGWLRPYGMPMEKFLHSIFVSMVLAPSVRKYETVNQHEAALTVLSQASSRSAKKAKSKYKVSKEAVK